MDVRQVEFEVALSFAGEDRLYVDQVANLLRDAGVKVFYDIFEEASLWGKNLYDYLSDIYQNKALYTVMFISNHYSQKMWPSHERQAMQARAFQEHQEYILPARFDETPIPGVLPTVCYIKLTEKTPAEFVELIKKKLVTAGRTIPSESLRKSLFSTTLLPRIDPLAPSVQLTTEDGVPVQNASIIAIADNDTTKTTTTNEQGIGQLTIPTRRIYRLLIAHTDFPGVVVESWDPNTDIRVVLPNAENTGSVICMGTGYISGLEGRLNPILDTSNRNYIYADNIAINRGQNQPANFKINVPFELEDCNGVIMEIRVLHIQGRTSLLQYVKPKYTDS